MEGDDNHCIGREEIHQVWARTGYVRTACDQKHADAVTATRDRILDMRKGYSPVRITSRLRNCSPAIHPASSSTSRYAPNESLLATTRIRSKRARRGEELQPTAKKVRIRTLLVQLTAYWGATD